MPARFRPPWLVVALAFAIPLGFALFTDHAWEDYFITLRSSRNLVEGHGLVFNPGERLHTFTSPLGVLVPALCTWIAGAGHEETALWFFRLINCALLAAAALLAWRRFDSLGTGRIGRFTFFGLVLADAKLTDFSINGMETAMLVFFVLLLWSEMESRAEPRPSALAIACAGLMWTRPDGFILGAAIILPHLVFRNHAERAARIPWRPLIRGLLLGAALYLPWFVWAWWYYGSPVPHTVAAKSPFAGHFALAHFLLAPWHTLTGRSLLIDLFLPTYWVFGGWPAFLPWFGRILSVLAAFAWLVPPLPQPARRASLAVFIGMFYLCAIVLFPWYSPPWTVLAALAIALTFDGIAIRSRAFASTARIVAACCVAVQVALLLGSAWEMRVQQRLIENHVRRSIGEWLHAHAAPGDTVFLEPLGYVGYYSRLKTFDYPGLSSPEVVAAIRSGAVRFTEIIARLHPTWLVLRPGEVADPSAPENTALRAYQLVGDWNVRPQLDAIPFLPGRGWLEHDARFFVFHRKAGP
ncbi:MAG TPA: hypothetical protein VG710_19210 [Opitutus sp.]|nr:hypothetical protein [Opitutus sp.]